MKFKPGLWLVGMKIWSHYRKYLLNDMALTWNTFFCNVGPIKRNPMHSFIPIVLFHNDIPLAMSRPNNFSLQVMPTNCRLYSNISQMLLLYKTWGYYNKFDSTKWLGVYYWSVKIPQCGYMEYWLKYNTLCVKKHIAPQAMCNHPPLVCR